MVRGWLHGRPRATRSERARELLTRLMPALLAAFGRQREPDAALARFDAVLSQMPGGVHMFYLFQRNPALLTRVAGRVGGARPGPAMTDVTSACRGRTGAGGGAGRW